MCGRYTWIPHISAGNITVFIKHYPPFNWQFQHQFPQQDYLQRGDALESLQKFGEEKNCDMLVLMGLKEIEDGGIRRDIGLLPLKDSDLNKQIMNELCIVHQDYLQLEAKSSDLFGLVKGVLFEQKNLKASRKQILPIIQKILD